ncbi:hypothetical protein FANTH_1612 [Fusarium anthophilum]|uniref:Prion-inhibition and propagation HeLo domain-containing protein n=1 Tax=Fusarium anthophilum TaxID=48485 RepID=A0A8H4ZVK1_9HYPO|nr:hypothetical protein FANTH_1612 [Fusarium anthophilum]
MEVVGLTAGILPLFKTCIDYFQLYKTAEASERDTRILLYKLDCEHERFIIWGERHGAFEEHPSKEGNTAPGLSDKVPQIEEALNLIRELLSDAEELYSHGLVKKTVWAINDKAKFNELVVQLRKIVESLYRVLPVPPEERYAVAVQDIGAIAGDLKMLEDFEVASQERYPEWSSAASVMREAGSRTSQSVSRVGDDDKPLGRSVQLELDNNTKSKDHQKPEALPFDPARRYYGSPIFVFTQDCISPASPKCSVERSEIDPDTPTFVFPYDKDKYWGLGNRITGIVDPKVDDTVLDTLRMANSEL